MDQFEKYIGKKIEEMSYDQFCTYWELKYGVKRPDIKVSRVGLPVKPACDGQILQAKIEETEYWLKFLNDNANNIIHKSSLIDRVKFLENENRKSV